MSRGRGRSWGENGFEGWGGYMAAKKAKLEGQFEADVDSGLGLNSSGGIFEGVAIFVNGYTGKLAVNEGRVQGQRF